MFLGNKFWVVKVTVHFHSTSNSFISKAKRKCDCSSYDPFKIITNLWILSTWSLFLSVGQEIYYSTGLTLVSSSLLQLTVGRWPSMSNKMSAAHGECWSPADPKPGQIFMCISSAMNLLLMPGSSSKSPTMQLVRWRSLVDTSVHCF